MIEKSLSYIQNLVNDHFKRQFNLNEEIVVLSNLLKMVSLQSLY